MSAVVSMRLEALRRVIVATRRYLGVGFDDPRIDILFLTMPVAWKGTLTQYAGRLHRLHEANREVVIYGYVDANVPTLDRTAAKRRRGYQALGYRIAVTEAQPASGQIKPKEDAAVRARHDRGVGDAWLAFVPSKDRATPPWSDLARRLHARRLDKRLDRNFAPDAAPMTRSGPGAEMSARLDEAPKRTANAGEDQRRDLSSQDRLRTPPPT